MISLVPFEDLVHAQIAHDLLDAVLAEIAVAAVELQRLVGDLEADIGGEALGHRAQHGGVGILAIERRGGAPQQRSRAASSSVAMSARRNCSAWNSSSRLPKALRSFM